MSGNQVLTVISINDAVQVSHCIIFVFYDKKSNAWKWETFLEIES